MNIKQFAEMVISGVNPVVEFTKGIEDCKGYPEVGMRGKIIYASNEGDNCTLLKIDFSEFDEFNKSFESTNYYGKDSNANLTAREAGYYTIIDEYYFDSQSDLEYSFRVVSDKSLSLYSEFAASEATVSYVEWLENKV